MKKSIIAILTTAVMILSFLGPALYSRTVAYALSPDPESWYVQVDGVLDTDYYPLYPYNAKSLSVGISKFGELIDNNTNVGLEYGGERDPWAAPAGPDYDPYGKLPKKVWINGWFLDMTWNHSSWGVRNIWIGALFGDLSAYGKPWLKVEAPYSCTYEYQENFLKPGFEISSTGAVIGTTLQNGGRKTNGTATTDPIKILYHGPREFVAQLVTHVWDVYEPTNDTLHVVDVMLTVIFNKVKKEVVLLKEVKVFEQAKYQISPLTVMDEQGMRYDVPSGVLCQFSDREEWDLGTATLTPKYASYVHFYTEGTALVGDNAVEGLPTVYDSYWTVLPTLPTNITILLPNANRSVNAYGPEPTNYTIGDTFDLAQIISNDKKYVGWAGYWPSLSDWSADAGGGRRDLWYRAMLATDPHDIDSFTIPNDEPFLAPLTVGEWDFMLSDDHRTVGPITTDVQFRGVAVYGVTDLLDGEDENMGYGYSNRIDNEVGYQLDEVFNPWSLSDYSPERSIAQRWVTKWTGDGEATQFYLQYSYLFPVRVMAPDWPYVHGEFNWEGYYDWYYYSEFSEKVLVDGVLMKPWTNSTHKVDKDYIIDYDGSGCVYVEFADAPEDGAEIKILFSTWANPVLPNGDFEWLVVGKDSAAIDSAGAAMVSEGAIWNFGAGVKMSALEMNDTQFGPDAPFILDPLSPELLPGRTGYRDAAIDFNEGRLALKDDWSCHEVDGVMMNGLPIASSDIITVGGPSANLATEYTNDFTDVIATLPGWTGPGLPQYNLFSKTCWSKNLYVPEYEAGRQTVGYGVISTYQDINGTTWLVIYGYTGQDTYYTCWALLHSDVLNYALHHLHPGVTTLILEFDYTLHPTDYCFVTIVEALGTISELDFQRMLMDDVVPDDMIMIPWDWPDTWIVDKFPMIHPDP